MAPDPRQTQGDAARSDGDSDAMFDAMFEDARRADPVPDMLMARVLADAASVQAAREAASRRVVAAPAPAPGLWRAAVAAMGGWLAVSGVTAAGVAGLMLGLYAPDLVDSLSGGQLWSLTGGVGGLPEIGALWVEGNDV